MNSRTRAPAISRTEQEPSRRELEPKVGFCRASILALTGFRAGLIRPPYNIRMEPSHPTACAIMSLRRAAHSER